MFYLNYVIWPFIFTLLVTSLTRSRWIVIAQCVILAVLLAAVWLWSEKQVHNPHEIYGWICWIYEVMAVGAAISGGFGIIIGLAVRTLLPKPKTKKGRPGAA